MEFKYNRLLIIILFIATFSGALRKWGINSSLLNNAMLGILLIIPNTLFLVKKQDLVPIPFIIYIIYLIFSAFNPLNTTIYHGLLGILIYLTFFVILLSYLRNSDVFDSILFSKIILVILLVEVSLGSIQYISPGDSFINKYAVEEGSTAGAALVGDAIRVTGTFSYIAGYTSFIYLGLFTVFFFIKSELFKQYNITLIILVIYGSLLSGSRATVGFVILTTIVFLLIEAKQLLFSNRMLKILISFVLILTVNFGLNDPLKIYKRIDRSISNFIERTENSFEEGQSRIFSDLEDVFMKENPYKTFGIGLGSTYQGANIIFGMSSLIQSIGGFEGEHYRSVLEGGFILFILKQLLFIYFLSKLDINTYFKFYLFLSINLFIPIVFNIYGAIYLAFGLILLNHAKKTIIIKKDLESGS